MFKKVAAVFAALIFSSALFAAKSAKEYVADLSSTDKAVVAEAVKWVGENKEKSAVPSLLNLVKTSSSADVKIASAVSLGLIGEKDSSEPLSEAVLSEGNSDVRYSIILAITRIGINSKKSVDNILLAKEKETDPIIKDFIAKIEQKINKK